MNLAFLRKKGIMLPAIETEKGLKAKDMMDKIKGFYTRLDKASGDIADFAPCYFLELLANFPLSICSRNMIETCKKLITLYYFASKPNPEEEEPIWDGFSYEDLSLIFDRSKASIHDAIKEKEVEVKELLEEVSLKAKARALALEELVEEEKKKLLEGKAKADEETNERTTSTRARERITYSRKISS